MTSVGMRISPSRPVTSKLARPVIWPWRPRPLDRVRRTISWSSARRLRRRVRPVKQLGCHPVQDGGGQQGPHSGEQCAARRTLRRGGGATQGQRPDSAGVVEGQLKGNGSAHRHAIHVGGHGAGCIEDSQRVVRHQRHGVGPGRVGAAADPAVVEPEDAVGRGECRGGAMPHLRPVSVAHDEQDRVARSALVPPDPGVRALGERHDFPSSGRRPGVYQRPCPDRYGMGRPAGARRVWAWYRPIAPGAALPAAPRNLAARSGPANAGPPRRAAALLRHRQRARTQGQGSRSASRHHSVRHPARRPRSHRAPTN